MQMLRRSLGTGHTRPMLLMPTGAGKTVVAEHIVQGALDKGKRVMFVVPAISLVNQTIASFMTAGIESIGVVQATHELTNAAQPVQVCSVQSLAKRKRLPAADVVLVDEAHRWFKFFERWFSEWNAVPFVGLSATPWTKGLGKHYDDLIIASTTAELIEQGYLSPFRVYAPSTPNLSHVRTVAGDYHEGDLADVMSNSKLVADIVTTWLRLGESRPTLCYAVDRAHARKLQNDFAAAGIRAGYIDAYTDLDEREQIRKQFHTSELQVVCNVGCLTEGVDWDCRCIILARPTKSEILFTQIIGRGLRTAEGKTDCLILDHSDTHRRLGFVTDLGHETLDDGDANVSGKQQRSEPLPKACPKCQYMKPAKVHECPACHFEPERQSAVVTEDGQLAELGACNAATKRCRQAGMTDKQDMFSQFLGIAQEKGYAPGWAAYRYKKYYGEWPNKLDKIGKNPGPQARSFCKAMQIRYAKSKKAAA